MKFYKLYSRIYQLSKKESVYVLLKDYDIGNKKVTMWSVSLATYFSDIQTNYMYFN